MILQLEVQVFNTNANFCGVLRRAFISRDNPSIRPIQHKPVERLVRWFDRPEGDASHVPGSNRT